MVGFCDLDWQAVATFTAGLMAVGAALLVGVRQTRILDRQTEIQERSLKSDLFDRRYRVFERVERYLVETLRDDDGRSKVAERDFHMAWGEARFLFESNVEAGIEEIWKRRCDLFALKRRIASDLSRGSTASQDQLQNQVEAELWFKEQLDSLPNMFDTLRLDASFGRPSN